MVPITVRLVTVAIAISILVITGGFYYINGDNIDSDEDDELWENYVLHYEIEIKPNQTANYTVYAPIPAVQLENNPSIFRPTALMDELILIKGNGTWRIVETEYGQALEVKSNEHIIIASHKDFINSNGEEKGYIFRYLSMRNDGGGAFSPYKIYYNSTVSDEAVLNLDIYNIKRATRGGYDVKWGCQDYLLQSGWQEKDLYISLADID